MNAKELREEFAKDLKCLQDNCKHDKSQWMNREWAPGHYGAPVRVCDNCEKVLESKKIDFNYADYR